MANNGFYFTRLEARGSKKTTASLDFTSGLNVISGASDTGKSYLVYCLNFMTGAKKPPKSITESAGYETLWLEIESWEHEQFTLQRSLRGKDFRLYRCGINDIDEDTESDVLKESRSGSAMSISEFLLDLCGLEAVELRTNAAGKVRPISFRDISHLTIINEERVYTEDSPVRATGQYVNKTVEESLFKYLLTGVDDSSVISEADTGESEGHRQARIDALESVITSTEDALSELTSEPEEITSQLERLRKAIGETTSAMALDREHLREDQSQRRTLWEEVETSTARLQVLSRLIDRFQLLERHYDSDLQRLRAMSEAGRFLEQLPQSECPVCGTENPWNDDTDLDQIQRACARETERIEMLHDDLRATTSDIQEEIETLQRGIRRSRQRYNRLSRKIEETLLPAEAVTREELSTLLETQSRLEGAVTLSDQIKRLREQLEEIQITESKPRKQSAQSDTEGSPKTSETNDFCKIVERLLSQWNFPDRGRVTFSETNQDLVINGKDRSSHGKGIRALSYAAFVVGLMRYSRQKERPYPGFVVLDSPLVAYREPDSMRDVEEAGVKESFYRSLAKKRRHTQVIVFENEEPPKDLIPKKINYVHFSGDDDEESRQGFFP